MKWWVQFPERLQSESRLMEKKFPQFKLGEAGTDKIIHGWKVASTGQKYWIGDLKTKIGHAYTVVVTYPFIYPGAETKAYIIKPYIKHTTHRYGNGNLCLYSNDHGGKGQGFGKGITAVTCIAWTAAWLHAYEIYSQNGSWPENDYFKRKQGAL